MTSLKRPLHLMLLSLALTAGASAAFAEDQLLYSERLAIHAGDTEWSYDFAAPLRANPLKVLFDVESSCPSLPYTNVFVDYGNGWVEAHTQGVNGVYYHSAKAFGRIGFTFNQPWYTVETCTLSVYAPDGATPDPEPSTESLAGVLDYPGGFVQRLPLAVSAAAKVGSFRVAIPSFCPGVEVLEAGTVTEGIYDAARGGDGGVFTVNGGTPARIGAVQVTLNGPQTAGCTIPVYVRP